MSKWYTIQALAADGTPAATPAAVRAKIDIFDEIGGWGIRAKHFIEEFRALPDGIPISLNIHSPGGDAFEALAMYHVLAGARERLTAEVTGLAASAATLPLMAAGTRKAPANGYIMIHNPITLSYGDAEEMRAAAALLDSVSGSLANIYASNTGADSAAIRAMMDAETWLDGAAALAAGFVHEVTDAPPVAATLTPAMRARFAHLPQALLTPPAPEPAPAMPAPPAAPPPAAMPAADIAGACVAAGEAALAPSMIRAGLDADSVQRRLSEVQDIRAIAAAAGRADDAPALIAAGVSVADARARLLAARAAEVPVITPHQRSDNAPEDSARAGLDQRLSVHSIYARRKPAAAPATLTP